MADASDMLQPTSPGHTAAGQTRLGEAFPCVLATAKADGEWAFEQLYSTFAPAVVNYLRRQGVEDPDGLANEVFLSAFRTLESFEGTESKFRSWLFTITHNRLVDERRRRSRRPRTVPFEDVPGDGPRGDAEAEALAALGSERITALLAALTPAQRDVLLLRIVGDVTVEQVAAAVGKRPGAVKALQRRGLSALRRALEQEGVRP